MARCQGIRGDKYMHLYDLTQGGGSIKVNDILLLGPTFLRESGYQDLAALVSKEDTNAIESQYRGLPLYKGVGDCVRSTFCPELDPGTRCLEGGGPIIMGDLCNACKHVKQDRHFLERVERQGAMKAPYSHISAKNLSKERLAEREAAKNETIRKEREEKRREEDRKNQEKFLRKSQPLYIQQLAKAHDEGNIPLGTQEILKDVGKNYNVKSSQGKRFSDTSRDFYQNIADLGGPAAASMASMNLNGPSIRTIKRHREKSKLPFALGGRPGDEVYEAQFDALVKLLGKSILRVLRRLYDESTIIGSCDSSTVLKLTPCVLSRDDTALELKFTCRYHWNCCNTGREGIELWGLSGGPHEIEIPPSSEGQLSVDQATIMEILLDLCRKYPIATGLRVYTIKPVFQGGLELPLYGLAHSFDLEHDKVKQMDEDILTSLSSRGINVIGVVADGDSNFRKLCLETLREAREGKTAAAPTTASSSSSSTSPSAGNSFSINHFLVKDFFVVRGRVHTIDFFHVSLRLRQFYNHPALLLAVGNHLSSASHLIEYQASVGRLGNLLVSDLNFHNKQDYPAVLRMAGLKQSKDGGAELIAGPDEVSIIDKLREEIEENNRKDLTGDLLYLLNLQRYSLAFLSRGSSHIQTIYQCGRVIAFLVSLRILIETGAESGSVRTFKDNFLSWQTYLDCLLSVMGKISITAYMRDNYPGIPLDSKCLSSLPTERVFQDLRSRKSTGGKITAMSGLEGLSSITSKARLKTSSSLLVGGGAGHLQRTGPRDNEDHGGKQGQGVAQENASIIWPIDSEFISELDRAWSDCLEELDRMLGGDALPSDTIKTFDLRKVNLLSTMRFSDQLKKKGSAKRAHRKQVNKAEEGNRKEEAADTSTSELFSWRQEEEDDLLIEEGDEQEGRASLFGYHRALVESVRMDSDGEEEGEDEEEEKGEEEEEIEPTEGSIHGVTTSSISSNRDVELGGGADTRQERKVVRRSVPEGVAQIMRALHAATRFLNSLRAPRSRERLQRFHLPEVHELMQAMSTTALGNISSLAAYDPDQEEDGNYIKLGDVVAGLYLTDDGTYFVDYTKVEKILLKDSSNKTREGLFRCDRTKPGALFAGGFLQRFTGDLRQNLPASIRARFRNKKDRRLLYRYTGFDGNSKIEWLEASIIICKVDFYPCDGAPSFYELNKEDYVYVTEDLKSKNKEEEDKKKKRKGQGPPDGKQQTKKRN